MLDLDEWPDNLDDLDENGDELVGDCYEQVLTWMLDANERLNRDRALLARINTH